MTSWVTPRVHIPSKQILSDDLRTRVIAAVKTGDEAPCATIGDGPYATLSGGLNIYVHFGPIGVHTDDAGMTYGYVIKGADMPSDEFMLVIGDKHMADELKPLGRMTTDSAFVINSDHDHAVNGDDNGLLLFIVEDFGTEAQNQIKPESLETWLTRIPQALTDWLNAGHPAGYHTKLTQGENA